MDEACIARGESVTSRSGQTVAIYRPRPQRYKRPTRGWSDSNADSNANSDVDSGSSIEIVRSSDSDEKNVRSCLLYTSDAADE